MADRVVFINTRDRLVLLRKTLPGWLAHSPDGIYLVVEPDEVSLHKEFLREVKAPSMVKVVGVPEPNLGLGGLRNFTVRKADRLGLASAIIADDDVYPAPRGNPWLLNSWVEADESIGMGGAVPFYGITLGNDVLRDTSKPIPVSGSWGYRLYALNIRLTLEAGNFDPKLDMLGEDHELCRQGIRMGYRWFIHTGVPLVDIAKRYSPGGHMSLSKTLEERANREKRCHRHMHSKWPQYVSDPSKKYRCAWKKMLKDYGLEED